MDSVTNYKKFKVLIIGEANVGKTALLLRHTEGFFHTESTPTIGIDFKVKSYTKTRKSSSINGERIRRDLHIWDTAGQERFKNITQMYYREAHGVFLIFDLNNKQSFDCLDFWLKRVLAEVEKPPIFILAGNKSDLPRKVEQEDIQEFTQKYKIGSYIETSARTNNNVDKMFDILVDKLILSETSSGGNGNIRLNPTVIPQLTTKSGCCA